MSKAEIRRAIKSLKNGKAPGEDMIRAELLKADLEFTTDRVKELIDTIWSLEKVPLKEARKGFLLQVRVQSTHAITNMHASARGHYNDAYLDRSCSTLMQMRTVKLSPTDFGYFSCNP